MILTPLALAFFTTRFGTARGSAPFPAWHPVRFAGRREGIQKSEKSVRVCVCGCLLFVSKVVRSS